MQTAPSTTAERHGREPSPIEALVGHLPLDTTVAAVWAHPDDESYLGAGLMAAIAERGGRVVNISATLGEHGTSDPTRFPPPTLAALRHRELTTALAAIGAESMTLGYEDGTCDLVPVELGAHHVGTALDEVMPDLVLTFGPDGVTGHPDHRAIAEWTARAVAERGDRIPLITTAAGAAWPADLVSAMHRVDAFYPGYPDRIVRDATWMVTVTGDLLERKLAALHAHASQIDAMHDELGAANYRRLASIEAYRAANAIALRTMSGHRALLGTAA